MLIKLPFSALLMTLILSMCLVSSKAWSNPKYASIVMDAESGKVLSSRYADKVLHPASLTKMMTLSILFDEIDAGRIKTYHKIRMSSHAAGMPPSKLDLPVGSKIRVKDAIYALVTKSANDVAVAVAEHVSGTEWQFAKRMTEKAKQIGMTNTNFVNASGLHHKRQVSTARDMAILARYMLHSQAKHYHYFSLKSFSYNGKKYRNHNKLLSSYRGMDGFKTGYVRAAGFNLVASAVRNDRRIIGVVYGGKTSKRRNNHMKVILDRGFRKIEQMPLVVSSIPVPPRKPVPNTNMEYAVVQPASGLNDERLRQILENSNIEEVLGQGDIDPEAIETISDRMDMVSIHKDLQSLKKQVNPENSWSIQVGAFFKRSQTNTALHTALNQLPAEYREGWPKIAPVKTSKNGWLYRARIGGYTKQEAIRACGHLKDCVPVSPKAK